MKREKKKESLSLVPRKVIDETLGEAEGNLEALTPVLTRIKKLKMNSDQNFQVVMDEGRKARAIQKQVQAKEKGLTSQCDRMKKEIKDLFVPMISACQEVLSIADEKRDEYDHFLDQKREEEQRKIDAEAEKEQKRLQKNANARAKRAPSEEQAKEIRHSVEEVEVKEVEKEAPVKIQGVSTAKIWDFEITDEGKVMEEFNADGKEYPLWARKFNRSNLLAVRAFLSHGEDNEQPLDGVRFFQKNSTRYGKL